MARLEIHEDIDIAVRPEIVPQGGAEDRQPGNMVPAAEIGDPVFVYRKFPIHKRTSDEIVHSAACRVNRTVLVDQDLDSYNAGVVSDEVLNEVTRRLVEGFHPEKIILFGSPAVFEGLLSAFFALRASSRCCEVERSGFRRRFGQDRGRRRATLPPPERGLTCPTDGGHGNRFFPGSCWKPGRR
jgi:hypothetical protein